LYQRYAIVSEADLTEGLKKLAVLDQSWRGTSELSHSSATISRISSQKPRSIRENMAEGARFESPEASETIGPDLTFSSRSQSLTEEFAGRGNRSILIEHDRSATEKWIQLY